MSAKRIGVLLALAAAAAGAAQWFRLGSEEAASPSVQAHAPVSLTLGSALPDRKALGTLVADPFFAPPERSAAVGASAPLTPAAPSAPPVPYRLAGTAVLGDRSHAVLAKESSVVIAKQGDKLDGGYRVAAVRPDYVTLLRSPEGERAKLPLTPAAPFVQQQRAFEERRGVQPIAALPTPVTSQPAQLPSVQLRWEGPAQVKAGDSFTVTVKGSASEPLSAVPLQLTYDPALLQLTNVKAGGFFPGGSFTSRTDKPGSVFVLVSGKATQPVDADLVTATFKPLRPSMVAELGVARAWQGGGANAQPPEAPVTLRTPIGN